MHEHLHVSILEHARQIAEGRNISLEEAIDVVGKLRPAYFNDLPLFSRPRDRHPPHSVTPHQVERIRIEAKNLRKRTGVQLAVALDSAAYQSGFQDWKHVKKMEANYVTQVEVPIQSGFAFALWYPPGTWSDTQWDPAVLASAGFIHDPRLFFATAEHLKHCYSGEDDEGGFYVLGYPVTNEDGSVTMHARIEAYLEALGADVYSGHNRSGLHFFRYDGAALPATLDEARALIEAALGPVGWNVTTPSLPPQPVSLADAIDSILSEADEPAPPLYSHIPAAGNSSNVRQHVPIVHYVWLKGSFVELDYYYF